MDSPKSVSSVESRYKIPPSIASLGREELERTAYSLLRRLQQKDKEAKESHSQVASVDESKAAETDASLNKPLREKAALEAKCQALTEERYSAQPDTQEVTQKVVELKAKLTELAEESRLTTEEKEKLRRELTEIRDEHQALQQQVATLKETIAASIEERDASFTQLSEERNRRTEMEFILSDAQSALRQLQQEVEALRTDKAKLMDTQQHTAESAKQVIEKERLEHHEAIALLHEKRRLAEEAAAKWQEETIKQSKSIDELRSQLQQRKTLEMDNEAAVKRIEELERELEIYASEKKDENGNESVPAELVSELKSRLQKQKEQTTALKAAVDSVHTELTKALEDKTASDTALTSTATELEQTLLELAKLKCENSALLEQKTAMECTLAEKDGHGEDAIDQRKAEVADIYKEVKWRKGTCATLEEKQMGFNSLQKRNNENAAHLGKLSELEAETEEQRKTAQSHNVVVAGLQSQVQRLEEQRKTSEDTHAQERKQLQARIKKAEKASSTANITLKELEAELTQLREALSKAKSSLEEEMQAHRICNQRFSDEQETSQHLKKQLQDALSKIQSSEVERWKNQEEIVMQQNKTDQEHLNRQEELLAEISQLQSKIAEQNRHASKQSEEIERVKDNANSEKEKLKRAIAELKKRLDRVSAQLKKAELEGTELQSSHFTEKERLEAEISHHQHQSEKIANELRDYRAKAHVLLRTKETELNAVKADLQHRTDLEIDMKVLQEKFDDLMLERDHLTEELDRANERFQVHMDDLVANFHRQIDEKTATAIQAKSQAKELQDILQQAQATNAQLQQQLEAKQQELTTCINSTEEQKETAVEEEVKKSQKLARELHEVKDAFETYKKTSEQRTESQKLEMSRLLQSNMELRRHPAEDTSEVPSPTPLSIDQQSTTREAAARSDNFQLSDLLQSRDLDSTNRVHDNDGLSESRIVALANKQAEREDTFHTLKRQNDQMLLEIEELEKELDLHKKQEAMLKEYLREADQLKQQLKAQPPSNMDFQYLKNTVMKLLTTRESETLLPVLAKLLDFSETESKTIMESILTAKNAAAEEASMSGNLLSTWTD